VCVCVCTVVFTVHRLRKHYASYEPAMQQLKQKYEVSYYSVSDFSRIIP